MKKILFMLFIVIIYSCSEDEILKNKGLTQGTVIERSGFAKGGYALKYKYSIKGIDYTGLCLCGISTCDYRRFDGKIFPVVYSTRNPEKSRLLVRPADFERWGLIFPDSLNWVKDCF